MITMKNKIFEFWCAVITVLQLEWCWR